MASDGAVAAAHYGKHAYPATSTMVTSRAFSEARCRLSCSMPFSKDQDGRGVALGDLYRVGQISQIEAGRMSTA